MQVTEQQNIKTKNIYVLPIVPAIDLLYSVEKDVFSSFTNTKKNKSLSSLIS